MHKAPLLITYLLWASLGGSASDVPVPPDDRIIEIATVMSFQYAPPAHVVEQMERELEAIMTSCNLQLRWRVLGEDDPKETFERVIFARFKGHCSARSGRDPDVLPGPLAVVHAVDGEILPFAEVNCDRVAVAIDSAIRVDIPLRSQSLLGRALARVLAHEMYHVFAGTAGHEKTGLAKCPLSARDLTSSRFKLDHPAPARMRENLIGPPGRAAEPGSVSEDRAGN